MKPNRIGHFLDMAKTKIKSSELEGEPLIEIRGHWEHGALDDLIRAFRKGVSKVRERTLLRTFDLDYLDSAAMGVIMLNVREMAGRHAKLVLLQPSQALRNALRAVKLDGMMEIKEG